MSWSAWPPRDWRALLALAGSILGAAVLTMLAAWIVWILWAGGWPVSTADRRIAALAKALLALLGTVAVVLLSLGLAINRRTLKANIGRSGIDFSGGDDGGLPQEPLAGAITREPIA